MKELLRLLESWMQRIFHTPETTFVFLLGAALIGLTAFIGNLLVPVFVSIGISYVMTGLKSRMVAFGVFPFLAFFLAYSIFFCILLLVLFVVLPIMIGQIGELAGAMPAMFEQLRGLAARSMEANAFSSRIDLDASISDLLPQAATSASEFSTTMLGYLGDALTLAIYLVIVPVLVFFLMKDYREIVQGVIRFLPGEKALAADLWLQIDAMLSNYVRGKVLEILIVWCASQVLFSILGLEYAFLLALLSGLSVVVPIVGVMVVTLPIVAIGLLQWGFAFDFWVLVIGFTILQIIDGYILVPLIFSETMKLHPFIIIIAVLIFGGLWGFWGAFLAIPLATLIKILLESWPRPAQREIPISST